MGLRTYVEIKSVETIAQIMEMVKLEVFCCKDLIVSMKWYHTC